MARLGRCTQMRVGGREIEDRGWTVREGGLLRQNSLQWAVWLRGPIQENPVEDNSVSRICGAGKKGRDPDIVNPDPRNASGNLKTQRVRSLAQGRHLKGKLTRGSVCPELNRADIGARGICRNTGATRSPMGSGLCTTS